MAKQQSKRKLHSITDSKKTSIRDGLRAMVLVPRFFKEIFHTSRFLFTANTLARLINSLTPILLLYVGKLLIDEIILQTKTETPDLEKVWFYVIIELSLAIGSDLINRITTLTDGLIGDLYSNQSSVKIIKKTNHLSIAQLEDADLFDKLERARSKTSSRVSLMSNILTQGQSIIIIISMIAGLIYFEPWLILLLIISIIPAFINEMKFSSQRYSIARSWTKERRELDYLRYIGANSNTAKEVKLYGLTDYIADRFKILSDKYYNINKSLAVRRSALGALFNVLGVLSYYGAYVLIIYRVISGVITIGDLTFLSGSFSRLRSRLQGLFGAFTRISENALYLKDYFDFLDIKNPHRDTTARPVPSVIQSGFQIRNLSFGYPGSDELVLDGVSFDMSPGETMAFVGQNGAGKTTLIKLLLRFYEPLEGQILLDGEDIRAFDKAEYQAVFGVIFQDFIKYEFLLRDNIGVGNIEKLSDEEAIHSAAAQSLADGVAADFKLGYDQQLGRRFANGKELSGGQWQKVALARAYMREAQVMILDEPTSALDAKAEFEAFERFMGLTKGRTSIIISHRFSTVRQADRILVLKDGRVSEIGTHEELMQNNDLYAELFSLQAAGYQ